MPEYKRKITEEQYRRATEEHDARGIFTEAEVMGYGVYCTRYYKDEEGQCWVSFELGNSCD